MPILMPEISFKHNRYLFFISIIKGQFDHPSEGPLPLVL